MTKYKLLDVVALARDLPELALRAGDRGTIVEFWKSGALEVEFLKEGKTVGIVTLEPSDVRPVQLASAPKP